MYFYDTGLACHLLGINNTSDVANSPLRGALFENLVVADMLKERYHNGEDNNLCFYRDKSQHEVDVVVQESSGIKGYEIKSATVLHDTFFKNLDYLRKLLGDEVLSTHLIYDGAQEWIKPDNGYLNFRRMVHNQ